ncbi:MAG: RNA pseudouridine synthase [Bdellovibrionaceae bacterium]|nr:RNA pseudouridine synthase [Pseudobdellovibrionaceae bacterium]NUM58286.1 RNA pseudouridine synthase [Pseudobdellovibrionaceae bacterium]
MKIIFEDENFIFVDKPSEVLTVPPRMKDSRRVLGLEIQNYLKKQIFPVHRLDYEVSGIVCFAKKEKAHIQAQKWFETNQVRKSYEAITSKQSFSHWPSQVANLKTLIPIDIGNSFTWESKILRGKKRSFMSPNGALAITEAQVERLSDEQIHWLLFPVTGKPHQLRLELSYRGFPIHGDTLYGSKHIQQHGIALNSYKLDLSAMTKEQRLNLPEVIEVERLLI